MTVNITKALVDPATSEALDELTVTLAWQNKTTVKKRKWGGISLPGGKAKGVDFDATALFLDNQGRIVRACSVDNVSVFSGAAVHSGDDEGKSAESSESINLTLSKIPTSVQGIGFVLASFTGAGFDQVNGADFIVTAWGKTLVEVMLPISERGRNAAVMAVFWRKPDQPELWDFTEVAQLLSISAFGDGNNDGAVNWPDLTGHVAPLFNQARRG